MNEPTEGVRGEYDGKEDHSIPVNEMLWNAFCCPSVVLELVMAPTPLVTPA